ncbi:MAG TPA: YhcH/YjgK/YiaL family protein [Flavisolibacter sp.]|nr:YhcH/YjgK/YiaL family protein [Flavisolibacter sp.]
MKRLFVLVALISFSLMAFGPGPGMSRHEAKKWFRKKEWLGGLKLQPHKSVDVQEFARQYATNKKYWDEAFAFLRDHDLNALAKGKYPIDGDNVTASITEAATKDFDSTQWESHRKVVDLQYVISGEEKMGVCPLSKATVTRPYNESRDVANYSAKGKIYSATPGAFFLFFPGNAHRPNITPGGRLVDKKIVIKVKAASFD